MILSERRRVAGFTLIELLVVIALLGILSALGAGAYFRIRTSQQVKNTEETVTKLETGFQSLWRAELDSARQSFVGKMPGFQVQVDTVKTLCDGDQDRALAVWNYIWMRRAFPQTYTQATTAITIATGITLPVPSTFSAPAFTAVTTEADEAAVILYRIMTQKGSRGQVFSEDAIGALSTPLPAGNTAGQKVFTDTFGNPITFVRLSSGTGELGSPPYTRNNGNTKRDPFDPAGRLTTGTWTAANRTTCQTLSSRTTFDGTINWLPTLVARGPAKDWGTLSPPSPPPLANKFNPDATGLISIPDGFICGYKLRRQGNRGDQ